MHLDDLAALGLTYREVGRSAGPLPDGYHQLEESVLIGHGRARYERAAESLLRWGMQRGAGLSVRATSEVAAVGTDVIVGLGPVRAPCRVVYVVDEAHRRGFAYGTLRGHPESGEESFSVRYDPLDDAVFAEVRAFSRHGTWWSRLAGPVAGALQRIVTQRYLKAV